MYVTLLTQPIIGKLYEKTKNPSVQPRPASRRTPSGPRSPGPRPSCIRSEWGTDSLSRTRTHAGRPALPDLSQKTYVRVCDVYAVNLERNAALICRLLPTGSNKLNQSVPASDSGWYLETCVCVCVYYTPFSRWPEESPFNYYKGICGLSSTQLTLSTTSKRGTREGGREGGGRKREGLVDMGALGGRPRRRNYK